MKTVPTIVKHPVYIYIYILDTRDTTVSPDLKQDIKELLHPIITDALLLAIPTIFCNGILFWLKKIFLIFENFVRGIICCIHINSNNLVVIFLFNGNKYFAKTQIIFINGEHPVWTRLNWTPLTTATGAQSNLEAFHCSSAMSSSCPSDLYPNGGHPQKYLYFHQLI